MINQHFCLMLCLPFNPIEIPVSYFVFKSYESNFGKPDLEHTHIEES